MVRIYRPSDRIEVKIGEISIKLAPLTLHQKMEVQTAMLEAKGKTDVRAATRGVALAIKYSLKSIKGVQDSDDNEYQLKFNGEELADECVDDLMNIEISNKLALICASMVAGVPKKFNGTLMEDVEIVNSGKEDSSGKP